MAGSLRASVRRWLLAVLAMVSVALAAPASAAAAPDDWTSTRLTTEHWYLGVDSVVDRWGGVHLVTRRAGAGGGVAYLRPRGDGTWSEASIADDAGYGPVAIALDAADRPVIAWTASDGIRVAASRGGRWTVDRFETRRIDGSPFDLAVGPDGTPYVAWIQGGLEGWQSLKIASRSAGRWRTRDLGEATGYEPVTLGVSPDGALHVGYARTRWNPGNAPVDIWYARVADARSTARRLGRGTGVRLVIDDAGRPVVAWDPMRTDDITVATGRDGRWSYQRASLPGFFWEVQGFVLQEGRPVVVGWYDDLEGPIVTLVATLRKDGSLAQRHIPDGYRCPPSALLSLGGGALGLPCLGSSADGRGTVPGVNLGILDGSAHRDVPVAREERYRVVVARAPRGAVVILTRRSDGELTLRTRSGDRWASERVPSPPGFGVDDLAIGPDGERAIVGRVERGRMMLLTDRSGRWASHRLGWGYSPQVNVDAHGRLHIGWVRSLGLRRADLRLAVGAPGAWRRWTVPRSQAQDYGRWIDRAHFFTRADGEDIVVWRRRSGAERSHGILMRLRDGAGWRSVRISRDRFEEVWSADLSPDGALGLVRGGLLDARYMRIPVKGRSTVVDVPYPTFFGADLTFDGHGRPGMLATGLSSDALFLIRQDASGWSRSAVLGGGWESARLAFEGDRPLLVVRREGPRIEESGFHVRTLR